MHKKLIIVFATDQGDCENLLHLLSFVRLHVLSAYYSMSRLAACVAICCDRLALKSQSSYTRGFFFIDMRVCLMGTRDSTARTFPTRMQTAPSASTWGIPSSPVPSEIKCLDEYLSFPMMSWELTIGKKQLRVLTWPFAILKCFL